MKKTHRLTAATSDEILARGAGMTLRAGVAASPFGNCLIAASPRGICHLSFFEARTPANAIGELQGAWPLAGIVRDDSQAIAWIEGIFSRSLAMEIFVRGTSFQLRIWRALMEVPSGKTVTYGALAAAAGNPHASRATGAAVGANPVAFLIPCHRVIRADGGTGGYRWGGARKQAMLSAESFRREVNPSHSWKS
jgi:AraC family transcriptional regulator, regulatory protein of adaptative response / methylated-DNA-[protein]-cysteine methyltransferase